MNLKEPAAEKVMCSQKEGCAPSVTVIVPVYKVEPYLRRCVDSILAQTFRLFDLVLVDDGSPDNCGRICDEYAEKDSRIHVIHQENRGLSGARNAGIEWAFSESSSEWLTFIDSDDWVHSEYLEILLSAAARHDTDIVIGRYVNSFGEDIPSFSGWTSSVWETEEYYVNETVVASVSWGKLIRKKYYESLRFPAGKIHEDEFTTYRILFRQEHLAVVDQPLYAYFQNENGIMRRKWSPARLDVLQALEEQAAFFKAHHYMNAGKKRYRALLWWNIKNQSLVLECEDLPESEKKKYIRNMKKQLRRVLLGYRGTGWCSFLESRYNRDIYMNAFPGLRGCQAVWCRIKPVILMLRRGGNRK